MTVNSTYGFFLLFLLLLLSGGGASSGSSASGSGGGTDTRSDVGDELLDVAALESLGEEAGPEGLDFDLGGLQDGLNLLGRDGDIVVGEDKGGVDASEFGVRHDAVERGN